MDLIFTQSHIKKECSPERNLTGLSELLIRVL